jgi:hypothetical protein
MTLSLAINPPAVIRNHCQTLAAAYTDTVGNNKFGAALGHLHQAIQQYDIDGTDRLKFNRQLVHSFLFAPEYKPFSVDSATQLTHGQRYAIVRWVGATFTQDWDYIPRPAFEKEAIWVLSVAMWIYAMTEFHHNTVGFGTLLAGYLTEEKANQIIDPDYWVKLAVELKDKIKEVPI